MPSSPHRWLPLLIRAAFIALAAGLLYWTWRNTDADVLGALRNCAMPVMAAAVLLYGLAQVLGALRWKILLDVQGLRLGLWTALKLTLVGNFFSLIIPGSVTGDLIKIACAARKYPGKSPQLALVDMIDRIIGLSGIFFAAALATLLCLQELLLLFRSQDAWLPALCVAAINAGCLGTIMLYVIFQTKPCWSRWRPVQWLRQTLSRRLPPAMASIAGRMHDGMELYRGHRLALLLALAISIAIHLTVSGTIFCIGRSLGESGMTPPQYILTTQLSNVTGLLPISPGGIGLRDAASARLLQFFQAAPAGVCGDIPLINSLVIVFWGLAGALSYAFSPSLKPSLAVDTAPSAGHGQ